MKPSDDGGAVDTEVRLAEIVFPQHCNHLGTLFGGQALAWMDKAAFLASSRHAGCTTVTARSERIDFRHPVRLGDTVEIVATIKATGRSSLTVHVALLCDVARGAAAVIATQGDFVMVAVGPDGAPVQVDRNRHETVQVPGLHRRPPAHDVAGADQPSARHLKRNYP